MDDSALTIGVSYGLFDAWAWPKHPAWAMQSAEHLVGQANACQASSA